jgi:hypothetical protein
VKNETIGDVGYCGKKGVIFSREHSVHHAQRCKTSAGKQSRLSEFKQKSQTVAANKISRSKKFNGVEK